MDKVLCVSTDCKYNKDNICDIGAKIEYKNILMLENWYMSCRSCKYFECISCSKCVEKHDCAKVQYL